MGQRREGIERRSHRERSALAVKQRQIDGDAARVRRPLARVGHEFRVGRMLPQDLLGLGRAKAVEDADPEPDATRETHRPAERLGCGAVEIAGRSRIHRTPGEVPGGRIGDVERDAELFGGDLYKGHAADLTLRDAPQ